MQKVSPKLVIGVFLALFIGISLYFRISLPYKDIFVGDWIKFSSNDAYFHMRMVDNIAHNFPHVLNFDPYFLYPGGGWISSIYFFDWLLAGIIWVVGLGSPSQHLIDVIGAYYPVALAALTIIPVYFIGKNLFNRWVGVIAAGLIAILPGEFMGRSIVGFTDNHVAETLFTTITMLLLILAIKSASETKLTFALLKQHDWKTLRKPLLFTFLAGVSLGIYLITWAGGLLFVFIIVIYLVAQNILDHLKARSTDYLAIIGTITLLIATLIFTPFSPAPFYVAALLIALAVPVVLPVIARLLDRRKLAPGLYPVTLVAAGAVVLAGFYMAAPSLTHTMIEQFSIFAPSGPSTTTLEMQPLFSAGINLPWGNFPGIFGLTGIDQGWTAKNWLSLLTSQFAFSIYSLMALAFAMRRATPERSLLVVWSLVILAATIGQRRFAYYFAANVALLTAYLAWGFLWKMGLKTLSTQPARPAETSRPKQKANPKQRRRAQATLLPGYTGTGVALVVVFFAVFFANFPAAKVTAESARFAPSNAWYSSMVWLKGHTPEPFGTPDYYYQTYPPQGVFKYPASAYSVTTWWDYGYWVSRIGHRIPSVNPSQPPDQIRSVAGLLLAQEQSAMDQAAQKMGSAYVIIDNQVTTSKFWAILTWAARPQTDYFEEYYLAQQKNFVRVFYPDYYRSLAVRLYNFDGKAVTPTQALVITWETRQSSQGAYKEITAAQPFADYQAANAYVQSQKTGNHRLVGSNPFISPVPLEALKNYKPVFNSTETVSQQDVGALPEVKIFEYLPSAAPAQK